MDLDLLDRAVARRRHKWEGAGALVEIVRTGHRTKPATSLRAQSPERAVPVRLPVLLCCTA